MAGDDALDVVVVGSGLAGLTTSALLARLGRRVALVEAQTELGGLARSYRRRGVDCPVGIHYFGAAGPGELLDRVWSAIGIAVPLRPAGVDGPLSRYHFGAETFDLPVGFDRFEAALVDAVPAERPAIEALVRSLRGAAEPLRMRPRPGALDALESAADFLRGLGCSARLMRLVSAPEAWLGMGLADCPRSSYELALASYLLSSWRLACTGAELVDRFAIRLGELGVELIAGDGATRLVVADGAVTGVVLASGRRLRAPRVVLSMHPKHAVRLFDDDPALAALAKRLLELPDTHAASMAFALVDAARSPARAHNTYRFDDHRRLWFQLSPSAREGKNLLTVVARDGFATWQRWAPTTTRARGAGYVEAKAALAERLLADVRHVASVGGVEWLDVLTPLSFRDWVGTFEGSLYGLSRGGLALAGLNRSAVRGLRFVGQSLLAPGVVGVTYGALRVAGDLAGRPALAALLGAGS